LSEIYLDVVTASNVLLRTPLTVASAERSFSKPEKYLWFYIAKSNR
jgi:hypothetical protein